MWARWALKTQKEVKGRRDCSRLHRARALPLAGLASDSDFSHACHKERTQRGGKPHGSVSCGGWLGMGRPRAERQLTNKGAADEAAQGRQPLTVQPLHGRVGESSRDEFGEGGAALGQSRRRVGPLAAKCCEAQRAWRTHAVQLRANTLLIAGLSHARGRGWRHDKSRTALVVAAMATAA
jgi:hypothetical protein